MGSFENPNFVEVEPDGASPGQLWHPHLTLLTPDTAQISNSFDRIFDKMASTCQVEPGWAAEVRSFELSPPADGRFEMKAEIAGNSPVNHLEKAQAVSVASALLIRASSESGLNTGQLDLTDVRFWDPDQERYPLITAEQAKLYAKIFSFVRDLWAYLPHDLRSYGKAPVSPVEFKKKFG